MFIFFFKKCYLNYKVINYYDCKNVKFNVKDFNKNKLIFYIVIFNRLFFFIFVLRLFDLYFV